MGIVQSTNLHTMDPLRLSDFNSWIEFRQIVLEVLIKQNNQLGNEEATLSELSLLLDITMSVSFLT